LRFARSWYAGCNTKRLTLARCDLGALVSRGRMVEVERIEGVNEMDKVLFESEPEVIEIEDLEIEELQERIVPSRYAIS
jgi:hypothetical protein